MHDFAAAAVLCVVFRHTECSESVQGIMIMAGAPDSAAAYKRKTFYQNAMRGVAINWSNCSNSGVGAYAGYENDPFCLCDPSHDCTSLLAVIRVHLVSKWLHSIR